MMSRLFWGAFLSLLFLCLPKIGISQEQSFHNILPGFTDFPVPNFQIPEVTQLEQETFILLKKKFPGQLIDKEFQTLKKLSEDRDYLDFLAQASPEERRFKNFEQFTENAQHPKERYFPFFEASFNLKTSAEMTSADITAAEILANSFWKEEVRAYHGEDFDKPEVFLNTKVQDWMETKGIGMLNARSVAGFQKALTKLLALRILVGQNEKGDAALVKKFFEKYGQNDGLLWLTIQKPLLLGRILDGFTDTEVFLKWVTGEFHQKKGKK